jgi:hypothetical protein
LTVIASGALGAAKQSSNPAIQQSAPWTVDSGLLRRQAAPRNDESKIPQAGIVPPRRNKAISDLIKLVMVYGSGLDLSFPGVPAKRGRLLPAPRTVSALRNDPRVAGDLREHAVALIALPSAKVHAAE